MRLLHPTPLPRTTVVVRAGLYHVCAKCHCPHHTTPAPHHGRRVSKRIRTRGWQSSITMMAAAAWHTASGRRAAIAAACVGSHVTMWVGRSRACVAHTQAWGRVGGRFRRLGVGGGGEWGLMLQLESAWVETKWAGLMGLTGTAPSLLSCAPCVPGRSARAAAATAASLGRIHAQQWFPRQGLRNGRCEFHPPRSGYWTSQTAGGNGRGRHLPNNACAESLAESGAAHFASGQLETPLPRCALTPLSPISASPAWCDPPPLPSPPPLPTPMAPRFTPRLPSGMVILPMLLLLLTPHMVRLHNPTQLRAAACWMRWGARRAPAGVSAFSLRCPCANVGTANNERPRS